MVLILPCMACLAALSGLRRWISLTLMVFALIDHLVALAAPAPVCMTIAVLLAYSALAQPALQKVGV